MRRHVKEQINRAVGESSSSLAVLAYHFRQGAGFRPSILKPEDKVKADYFTGCITFNKDKGAYVPEFQVIETTRQMRLRIMNEQKLRIQNAWKIAAQKPNIRKLGAGKPILLSKDNDQHVYFMMCRKTGLVKIGMSKDPARRLREVQNELIKYFPEGHKDHPDIELLYIVDSGAKALEKKLHDALAHCRVKRGPQTEWFTISPELEDYFEGIVKGADPFNTIPKPVVIDKKKPVPRRKSSVGFEPMAA